MREIRAYIAALLIAAITVSASGCAASARAADLMDGILPNAVAGNPTDQAFIANMAEFSVELFKRSITYGENSLISPLSVMLALAMTANGANGETLAQMEALLGGGITLDELNEYLYTYVKGLPNYDQAKLHIANSIWFRDHEKVLRVEPDFLQRNADYFGAAAYRAAFDAKTVEDVNEYASIGRSCSP